MTGASARLERRGDAGVVTMDAPPVNAIGRALRAALAGAVAEAERLGLSRVVLTGAGRAFAAGGDAREFDAAPEPPHLHDLCDAIEASPVPWIAALNGAALGGGLELAMACRARVAAPEARLGLPEVTLGVIPGAGGAARLPRLVGLAAALDMVAGGKPIAAERALALGLVDAVADDPVAAAMDLAPGARTLDRPAPDEDGGALDAARARLPRGAVAPPAAVDAVADGCRLPAPEAVARARETFLRLREGPQSRALRHLFFAERAAGRPPEGLPDAAVPDHVAVAGGGTMGAGIAWALLAAGLSVTLLERPEGLARARAAVEGLADDTARRGRLDAAGRAAAMDRLAVTADAEAARGAGLAIEAVFEDMDAKRAVLRDLAAALGPEAVLATNTSYLDVDALAAALPDPSALLGLHFFAPAHVMRLLEIVRGRATAPRTLAVGFALAARLRKVPVVVGVCDGFVGNRLLARGREAADAMVLDGADPQAVDAAMEGFGYAMGPYAVQDLSGLDIGHAARRRQDATRDPARRYVGGLGDRLVEAGHLGRKTGAGWYAHPGRAPNPAVARLLAAERDARGVAPRDFDADEIVERILLAQIDEARAILQEGIAARPADVDLVTVLGYGFPRWRGGLMHHAEAMGRDKVDARIAALAAEDPAPWRRVPWP